MSIQKGMATSFFISSEDSLHKLTNNCVHLYSEASKVKMSASLSAKDFSSDAKNAGIVGYGYKTFANLAYYFGSEESLVKFQMKYL